MTNVANLVGQQIAAGDMFPQDFSNWKRANIAMVGNNIDKQSNKNKHNLKNVPIDGFQLDQREGPKRGE